MSHDPVAGFPAPLGRAAALRAGVRASRATARCRRSRERPRLWLHFPLFGLTMLSMQVTAMNEQSAAPARPHLDRLCARTKPSRCLASCSCTSSGTTSRRACTACRPRRRTSCRCRSSSLFGTLGAVITMNDRIRSRKALLDIGAAGPIAGMVVAMPVLCIGLSLSKVEPRSADRLHPGGPEHPVLAAEAARARADSGRPRRVAAPDGVRRLGRLLLDDDQPAAVGTARRRAHRLRAARRAPAPHSHAGCGAACCWRSPTTCTRWSCRCCCIARRRRWATPSATRRFGWFGTASRAAWRAFRATIIRPSSRGRWDRRARSWRVACLVLFVLLVHADADRRSIEHDLLASPRARARASRCRCATFWSSASTKPPCPIGAPRAVGRRSCSRSTKRRVRSCEAQRPGRVAAHACRRAARLARAGARAVGGHRAAATAGRHAADDGSAAQRALPQTRAAVGAARRPSPPWPKARTASSTWAPAAGTSRGFRRSCSNAKRWGWSAIPSASRALNKRARASRRNARTFVTVDARDALQFAEHDLAIGLHACGELGDRLVEAAARAGCDLALVSCCLQKISTPTRQPAVEGSPARPSCGASTWASPT